MNQKPIVPPRDFNYGLLGKGYGCTPRPAPRTLSGAQAQTLARVCERQNWRCCFCGVRMPFEDTSHPHHATRDHIIPRSEFRSNPRRYRRFMSDNIVAACYSCNNQRGDRNASVFFKYKQAQLATAIWGV